VASHGKFESDVRDTFLLTYDGKLSMDRLEGYMASTTYREQPVELLTLSACQTAVGDDKAALGLGGVAVKAGARSALATLWYINDQASSLLITDFYANLKDSDVSKARALQEAQLDLLDDPRFNHPSYWAPFLLIGNWL
jgi:CHAT domain-containing protein